MLVPEPRLTRRVGAATLATLAIAIGFFVFVYDRIEWGAHVRLHAYFTATGGLVEGAPLVVGGREVGRVESIALVPRGAAGPLAGEPGVAVAIAIDARAARDLHVGDVFVAARGPLSGKYLELGPAAEGAPLLRAGDELRGRDPPSLDRVVEHTWDNLTTLGNFAADLKPELDAVRAQIDALRGHFDPASTDVAGLVPAIDRLGPLVADASAVSDQLRALRDGALDGDAGLARMRGVIALARSQLADTRGAIDRLSASAAELGAKWSVTSGPVAGKLARARDELELAITRAEATAAKLDPLLAQIDALSGALARGEGSLMKLMKDPEFPEDAKELGKILKRHPWKVMDHP